MSHLFILPCSATKACTLSAAPMPARDAYVGTGFRMLRRQLEMDHAKWCILSGHYGFLWPDTLIGDYNVKMEPVTPATVWDDCFGHITDRQYGRLMSAAAVTVLGSRFYADAAAVLLKRPVHAPFAGLSIGRILSAINRGEWRNPQLTLPV